MFNISEIRHLHIELSTLCNARCPKCPRNLNGYPINFGYEETNLSLATVTKSFSKEFIQQLQGILINGNFGDITANTEAYDIVKHFRNSNVRLFIEISTNGSARNIKFWQDLGTLYPTVKFCLDGLEDTHHLYRQDTDWKKIISNAQAFKSTGGIAVWKMVKFDHNQHQVEQCRALAKELGFDKFELVDHGRDTGPVFDRKGTLTHKLGKWQEDTKLKDVIAIQHIPREFPAVEATTISCKSKNRRSIYISGDGKVYPCCYLGFSPDTFRNRYFNNVNEQISAITSNNSLHDNDLATCINWFNTVEESWKKDSYESGRLLQCDSVCGQRTIS